MEITIYQINSANRNFLFSRWKDVKDEFSINNYNNVWTGTEKDIYGEEVEINTKSEITLLEHIFTKFNLNHPSNFHGHSLSVSDVVKIDEKYFYCDSFGWQDVTSKIK